MAILTETRYNADGDLIAGDVFMRADNQKFLVRGKPTFERGHFHYFEFRAEDQNQLLRKMQRFMDLLDEAGGKLVRYSDGVAPTMPGRPKLLIAHLLYVVE